MTRFKPSRPRAALALAAFTLSTLTVVMLVALPTVVGAHDRTWALLSEASATAASSWAEAASTRNFARPSQPARAEQPSRPTCQVHA